MTHEKQTIPEELNIHLLKHKQIFDELLISLKTGIEAQDLSIEDAYKQIARALRPFSPYKISNHDSYLIKPYTRGTDNAFLVMDEEMNENSILVQIYIRYPWVFVFGLIYSTLKGYFMKKAKGKPEDISLEDYKKSARRSLKRLASGFGMTVKELLRLQPSDFRRRYTDESLENAYNVSRIEREAFWNRNAYQELLGLFALIETNHKVGSMGWDNQEFFNRVFEYIEELKKILPYIES